MSPKKQPSSARFYCDNCGTLHLEAALIRVKIGTGSPWLCSSCIRSLQIVRRTIEEKLPALRHYFG